MASETSLVCPICSAPNPITARSCGTCGAPLTGDSVVPFSSALPPGTKLHGGLYSVGKALGQGGFGITYLGGDIRGKRAVAIKEFFPAGSTRRGTIVSPFGALSVEDYENTKKRFLDETEILSRFDHPGIVDVYGAFPENNTVYMVMELLRGRTLSALIAEKGYLGEQEAVDYIVRVGEALEAVHSKGLLHRDLKPDNIMLTDDGRVVLIDFGSARTYAAGKTGRMTRMVTPGYAPLEQYGERVRFGPFTDVYALGGTLYHALTGQMPAPATDRVNGVELQSPHEINPMVSPTVSNAVMWAMKMRVDERPQTARAFLDALKLEPRVPTREFAKTPDRLPSERNPTKDEPVPVPTPPRPTWRPSLPYDGPYDIEIRGEEVAWPNNCACCFQPADTTLTVEHAGSGGFLGMIEETGAWDVPYCSQCLEHIRLQKSQPGSGVGGAVVGGLIGGPLGLLIGLGSAARSIIGASNTIRALKSCSVRPVWRLGRPSPIAAGTMAPKPSRS